VQPGGDPAGFDNLLAEEAVDVAALDEAFVVVHEVVPVEEQAELGNVDALAAQVPAAPPPPPPPPATVRQALLHMISFQDANAQILGFGRYRDALDDLVNLNHPLIDDLLRVAVLAMRRHGYRTHLTRGNALPQQSHGKTDKPFDADWGNRRVRVSIDDDHHLPGTVIHEYTHLALIHLFNPEGVPWRRDGDAAHRAAQLAMTQADPAVFDAQWKTWYAGLPPVAALYARDIVSAWGRYGQGQWLAEMVPHTVEIFEAMLRDPTLNPITIQGDPFAAIRDVLVQRVWPPLTVRAGDLQLPL
jgi:hypothetical protein